MIKHLNLKAIVSALATTIALALPAAATTLTPGSSAEVLLTSGGSTIASTTVTVGAGSEGSFFGNQFYDLNGGVDGDTFSLSSTGNFCGYTSCNSSVTNTFTLSSLDFVSPLGGLTFITNTVGATLTQISATAISFSWNDGISFGPGVFIAFKFDSASAVPLPAAGFLMLAAVGGLGVASRRRRAKAA